MKKNPIWKGLKPFALLLILTASATFSFAQSQTAFTPILAPGIDGEALFKKLHNLRVKLQRDNSEENGLLYLLNTPENLHMRLQFFQMMPNDKASTSLHLWAQPSDVSAHPELLGTSTDFPQMWVRYHGSALVEVGASNVNYPSVFGIDAKTYPHMIYDVEHKTVRLYLNPVKP